MAGMAAVVEDAPLAGTCPSGAKAVVGGFVVASGGSPNDANDGLFLFGGCGRDSSCVVVCIGVDGGGGRCGVGDARAKLKGGGGVAAPNVALGGGGGDIATGGPSGLPDGAMTRGLGATHFGGTTFGFGSALHILSTIVACCDWNAFIIGIFTVRPGSLIQPGPSSISN